MSAPLRRPPPTCRRARRSSGPRRRQPARASISCKSGSGASTIARLLAHSAWTYREAIAATGARLLVNDRIDVALAARADGVHLPGRAVSGAVVRAIVPDGFLVGRSVHDAGEAIDADATVAATTWCLVRCSNRRASRRGMPLPASTRSPASARPSGCRFWRLAASPRHECRTSVRAGAAGIAAIGLFATGGEGERRDTVGQIRLAFGVSSI